MTASRKSGQRKAGLALALLAVLAVSGCGKKGPPQPEGPSQDVTYPRTYPAR